MILTNCWGTPYNLRMATMAAWSNESYALVRSMKLQGSYTLLPSPWPAVSPISGLQLGFNHICILSSRTSVSTFPWMPSSDMCRGTSVAFFHSCSTCLVFQTSWISSTCQSIIASSPLFTSSANILSSPAALPFCSFLTALSTSSLVTSGVSMCKWFSKFANAPTSRVFCTFTPLHSTSSILPVSHLPCVVVCLPRPRLYQIVWHCCQSVVSSFIFFKKLPCLCHFRSSSISFIISFNHVSLSSFTAFLTFLQQLVYSLLLTTLVRSSCYLHTHTHTQTHNSSLILIPCPSSDTRQVSGQSQRKSSWMRWQVSRQTSLAWGAIGCLAVSALDGVPLTHTHFLSLSLSFFFFFFFFTCTMHTIINNTWVHTTNKTKQVAGEG